MEILQLRYFLESARQGSFARTAERYGVPATSVSASVKRLEKELGCELFHRSCNRIMLSDKGKKLENSLEIVFNELDSTVETLTSSSKDTREIKMLIKAVRSEITDYIIEYKNKHPHISFKTVFDFDETDFEKFDIIIDEMSDNYPGFENFRLHTDKICLRVSKKSNLCGKKLTLKQLKNEDFITIGENNSMSKILISACKKAGFTPKISVKSNDVLCCMKCVEAGIGIGLGRKNQKGIVTENTCFLSVADFDVSQTICTYYKPMANYGNIAHFLKFLKSKIR